MKQFENSTEQNSSPLIINNKEELDYQKKLRYYKIKMYLITFFAYAAVHSTRTCWSQAKTGIKFLSDNQKSYCDTTFLFCYALAMKTVGTYGDRMNLTYFISFGMLGAALTQCALALSGIYGNENFWIIIVLEGINGIFQSTQWPGLLAVMGNWYGKGHRGLLMGVWAGCCNVGDIIGLQIFSNMSFIWLGLEFKYEWGYTILLGSCFLFLMAIIVFLALNPYPQKLGFNILENDDKKADPSQQKQDGEYIKQINDVNASAENSQVDDVKIDQNEQQNKETQQQIMNNQQQNPLVKITYFSAWCFPFVAIYALTYACIKSTNYGFLFWLPTYIDNMNQEYTVNMSSQNISSMFDYGTFFGGILTGYITDKMGKRALFMIPELIISTALMLIVKLCLTVQNVAYYFVIFLIGFFFGGPYNIISAAIAIDLSKQKYLQNNKQALSTVSSLIESTGSLSAAILQIFCSMMGNALFYLFAGLTCAATCILIYISLLEKLAAKKGQ